MLQQMIEGVVFEIRKEFGGDKNIYLETVKQGLQKPCFFVLPKEMKTQKIRGGRLSHEIHFQVTYLPENEDGRAECYAVGERLLGVLGVVKVRDGAVRGRKTNIVVDDGLLHFSAIYEYQFFVEEQKGEAEHETMEALQINFSQ
ncbi:MAG: hypothetical protein R3Y53_11335 [Bacillota bacterium]